VTVFFRSASAYVEHYPRKLPHVPVAMRKDYVRQPLSEIVGMLSH